MIRATQLVLNDLLRLKKKLIIVIKKTQLGGCQQKVMIKPDDSTFMVFFCPLVAKMD